MLLLFLYLFSNARLMCLGNSYVFVALTWPGSSVRSHHARAQSASVLCDVCIARHPEIPFAKRVTCASFEVGFHFVSIKCQSHFLSENLLTPFFSKKKRKAQVFRLFVISFLLFLTKKIHRFVFQRNFCSFPSAVVGFTTCCVHWCVTCKYYLKNSLCD